MRSTSSPAHTIRTGFFENHIKVSAHPKAEKHAGGGGERKPPKDKDGAERERPSELEAPNIKRVYREDWEAEGFDEFTAMKLESLGYSDDETSEFYEFKVNMNNMPLESEAKLKRLSKEATTQAKARSHFPKEFSTQYGVHEPLPLCCIKPASPGRALRPA